MIDYDAIFRSFVRGDLDPFYKMMYPGLMIYTSRTLGGDLAYMAEDCLQDAVMSTYVNRGRFGDADHWRAFMITCINNRAINISDHEDARRNYIDRHDHEIYEKEMTYALIHQETIDSLYAAIAELPEEYRQIIRMSFGEGLKSAEIAERLNIADITVKKRKARLLKILRAKLGNSSPELFMLLGEICTLMPDGRL